MYISVYDYLNNHLQAAAEYQVNTTSLPCDTGWPPWTDPEGNFNIAAEYLVNTTSSPFNFIPYNNPVIAPFPNLNCLLGEFCSTGSEELELQ